MVRAIRPVVPLFRNPRVTARGDVYVPRGMKRAATRLNQALAERGVDAPWYMTRDQTLTHWQTQADSTDNGNSPSAYAAKDTGIVDFLHEFWQPHVNPADRIVEFGSNAGANLERLRQLGYRRLSGVEINPRAIERMHLAFPDLDADVREGAFESVLPTLDPVDVVFTMGTLMHVHPRSQNVFAEIARLGRFVCTVELETASNSYVFPRDYRRVFERLGCRQVRWLAITPGTLSSDPSYDGCVVRLFEA
jgi:SAM-dependent methyltransferase